MSPLIMIRIAVAALSVLMLAPIQAQVLFDNGPLVTSTGSGPGGGDVSAVQLVANESVTGYGAGGSVRVADDFVVPPSGWVLEAIELQGFEPGANRALPPATQARVRLWSGVPESVGATLVFDSNVAAASQSVAWTDLWRTVGNRPADDRRPVFQVQVRPASLTLPSGQYWIEWRFDEARAAARHAVPVTRVAQAGSGNAIQRRGGTWTTLPGTGSGVSLAFRLLGAPRPDRIFADGFEG